MNITQTARRTVLLMLCVALSSCAVASKLKFWDKGYEFETGEFKVTELRRALLCGTPAEQSEVQLFDSVQALKDWDVNNKLQLDRITLPDDKSFVLLEQGRRQTGGYTVELRKTGTVNEAGVLQLKADWLEPGPDRIVTQIITSLCVLATVEAQPYTRVEVMDGSGELRVAREITRED